MVARAPSPSATFACSTATALKRARDTDPPHLAAILTAGTGATAPGGHPSQARETISAGADGLAHLFAGETVAAGFGELAARQGVFVVPTLSTLEAFCGRPNGASLLADSDLQPFLGPMWRERLIASFERPARPCAAIGEGMRQLVRAGASVVAGTDAPNPGTAYGASLHGELALYVSHGMTPVQALASGGRTRVPPRGSRPRPRGVSC